MALFKPDPPTPPNPIQVAGAQTGTNVSTAVANAFLNNVNQQTPTGSLNYSPTGNYGWTDPSTGQTYNIPTFTATQSLSPWQQYAANNSEMAQVKLAELANIRGHQMLNQFANPLDVTGAPAAGDYNWLLYGTDPTMSIGAAGQQQGTFDPAGQQQTTFGDAGQLTRSYGPADSFSADRQRVEESLFQRMNPQLERDEARLRQQLADQGIRYGSDAYRDAWQQMTDQRTTARLGAVQAGGQEQQRMMDMAAQRAGFENMAQAEAFKQAMTRGEFANTAQAQQYMQNMQRGQFANEAQRQVFAQEAARANFINSAAAQRQARNESLYNAANSARNQYMQEQYALRNQPLNEISALMSGSQVQNPQWLNTPNSQIPTTDVAGLINNRFTQDMSIYQQQNTNFNQLMGGIFGMMGSIGKGVLSDRREKENIDRIGTVFAANENGEKPLPVYEYSYKADPSSTRHVGPMAQDVEKIDKRAVKTRGGKKYIDTTRLGSILKVA